MHEDILAAPIWSDEAKSPHGVVPLDRAVLFDDGLVGRGIDRPLRPSASGHFLRRSAAVDTQDFGHLQALGTGTGADLERRARRKATVAAALDHTHMQEGITGPIGKLYEAKTFVWIVPFDDGLDRGPGRRVKPLDAEFRRRSEIAPGRFVVVVGEGAATRRTKISVLVAHLSAWPVERVLTLR